MFDQGHRHVVSYRSLIERSLLIARAIIVFLSLVAPLYPNTFDALRSSCSTLPNRWNWGNGHPSGTVKDVREEDTEIESKNGKPVRNDDTSSQICKGVLTDDGTFVMTRMSR